MTFDALKHRDVPEVNRVLEGLVCMMTALTLAICKPSEIHRVLERTRARVLLGRPCRIEKYCVTDITVVSDHFAGVAHVLTIVAAKATR